MTTEVTKPQSFEQRMSQRIKDSIGDLISDDDLAKLVKRGIEEAFFARRPNPARQHSYNAPDTIDPLIHTVIKELLLPAVTAEVAAYLKQHNEEVLAMVKTVVENGVGNAVVAAMNSQFQMQLYNFQSSITNQLASK